jgi:hypothetical protein
MGKIYLKTILIGFFTIFSILSPFLVYYPIVSGNFDNKFFISLVLLIILEFSLIYLCDFISYNIFKKTNIKKSVYSIKSSSVIGYDYLGKKYSISLEKTQEYYIVDMYREYESTVYHVEIENGIYVKFSNRDTFYTLGFQNYFKFKLEKQILLEKIKNEPKAEEFNGFGFHNRFIPPRMYQDYFYH